MNPKVQTNVSSWSKVVSHRDLLSQQEFTKASRYRARYDFAKEFRDISTPSVSQQTKESYFVLLKLGLAYSSIETLEKLLENGRRVAVRDEAFTAGLESGEFTKFLAHLQDRARRNEYDSSKYLEKYLNPKRNVDLADFVRHSRNVVFHGSVTPHSIGLSSSKNRRELVLSLANSSLVACNREFSSWAKRIENRAINSSTLG